MNLGRTFWKVTRYARAARFWLLLALAALAWCAAPTDAYAQTNTFGACPISAKCPRDVAYAKCEERSAYYAATLPSYASPLRRRCVDLANPGAFRFDTRGQDGGAWSQGSGGDIFHYNPCPTGTVWFGGRVGRCDTACASRPSQTTLFNPKPGSMTCERGCMRSFHANGDGETMTTQSTGQQCVDTLEEACAAIPAERGNFVRNPLLGVCEPVSPECPAGMKPVGGKCEPNDFCPIGQILNENNVCEPREGECPAGSTRALDGMCRSEDDDGNPNKCPAGQVKGSDGTCKPDTNEDGEADDGSDTGTFSGGDSCKVPPMCSGDAILCGQARIQWRIDCNTRRNQKISGGGCAPASMPVCVGESCDLMQYAQLVQAWNTRCAVEELARRESTGGGDDNGEPVAWDPTVDAAGVVEDTAGTGEPDDAFTDESSNNDGTGGAPGGTGELDTSGFGWSRSCPNLPSVTVMGGTLDFNAVAGGSMCNWFQLAGQIVLILAAMLSLRILSSSTSV